MAAKQVMGASFDPTTPLAKVVIADYNDTAEYIRVLLNPTSIEFSINVGIGKLQPVGWSNPIKQYSHTGEVVSGLELVINEYVLARYKAGGWTYARNKVETIDHYVKWLSSYCYASSAGNSPGTLILHWPYVTTMSFVIESMKVKYTRFNRRLAPIEGNISLNISEVRTTFCDSLQQGLTGFIGRCDFSGPGKTSGSTGSPLNPGSGV